MNTTTNYAVLTAEIRHDKRLKPNEKLLYAEITALSKESGECIESNKYFAELYDSSSETVSRWVSNLKKYKYIDTKNNKDTRVIIPLTKLSNDDEDSFQSQANWILDKLKSCGSVTRNQALSKYITRLSSIIFNLKAKGWVFKGHKIDGDFEYVVISKPKSEA